MSNDPTERLRQFVYEIDDAEVSAAFMDTVDTALAAEWDAGVKVGAARERERIRVAMRDNGGFEGENLDAILDAETGEDAESNHPNAEWNR